MNKHPRIVFIVLVVSLLITMYFAFTTGKLSASWDQVMTKITTGHEPRVDAIIDLRMPRIIIALFVGAALAVSGALLQAVLQNPLAEANIIGVTSGALLTRSLILLFIPTWYFYAPLMSFIGGIIPFLILLWLFKRYHMSPVRIILVGVAMYAMLNGVLALVQINPLVKLPTGLSLKVWKDVYIIVTFSVIGIVASTLFIKQTNLLSFEEKQANNIGFHMTRYRMIIGLIAVFLASSATAIVGEMAFVGLIVPHIVRRLVGSNYKNVIPNAIVLGALVVLIADTLGRTIVQSHEIPANVLTVILGGPFLIYLICKGAYRHAGK